MTLPYMLKEIRQQPEVLDRVLRVVGPELRAVAANGAPLHLTGCGDPYFAACSVQWLSGLLWHRRVQAWRSIDLRWIAHQLVQSDLIVCGSVSGRTHRTLEAARLARASGARVVALTDNPGSPVTAEADQSIILGTSDPELLGKPIYAGYEHQVPQTKTYSALLFAELLLACPGPDEEQRLHAVPATLAGVIDHLEQEIESLAPDCFVGCEEVVVLASGPFLPSAAYGAAKMIEYAVPSLSQCLEEYNHLEAFVASERTLVVHLAPDAESASRSRELTEAWERLGARSLVVLGEGAWPERGGIQQTGGGSFGGRRTRCLEVRCGNEVATPFVLALVCQLLALFGARQLGRDLNEWVGGRRTDLIQSISMEAIRGSQLWPSASPGS